MSKEIKVKDPKHGVLPVTVVAPCDSGALPLCLFLYGGGGNARNLFELVPIFEAGFSDGSIAPMVVACLGVPPWCFYLDDASRGMAWETAVADTLRLFVRRSFETTDRTGLVGVSMGGYGALKIAFSRPEQYAAVAAVAPMLEPSLDAEYTPLRNRFHYPPECPEQLVGSQRDRELFACDHPAARARAHAEAILAQDLCVYIDAGSRDAVHAHDGAELLHRVLWDLDIVHEYHLHRDADHIGPSLVPRMRTAFAWVGARLNDESVRPSEEEAMLHAALAPLRERALAEDPTVARTYGILPRSVVESGLHRSGLGAADAT